MRILLYHQNRLAQRDTSLLSKIRTPEPGHYSDLKRIISSILSLMSKFSRIYLHRL